MVLYYFAGICNSQEINIEIDTGLIQEGLSRVCPSVCVCVSPNATDFNINTGKKRKLCTTSYM